MHSGKLVPVFQRNLLPKPSGQKNEDSSVLMAKASGSSDILVKMYQAE
jgi:hypothetical protein